MKVFFSARDSYNHFTVCPVKLVDSAYDSSNTSHCQFGTFFQWHRFSKKAICISFYQDAYFMRIILVVNLSNEDLSCEIYDI